VKPRSEASCTRGEVRLHGFGTSSRGWKLQVGSLCSGSGEARRWQSTSGAAVEKTHTHTTHHSSHKRSVTIVGSDREGQRGTRAAGTSEAAKSTRSRSCGLCQRQSKMLVITWANWQARNVTRRRRRQPQTAVRGHGRCSVERCFLKVHRSRGVSSIGGFVCHPVEWQLGSLSTARARTGQRCHNGAEATGGEGRGGACQ
jgi:hypothetical protein